MSDFENRESDTSDAASDPIDIEQMIQLIRSQGLDENLADAFEKLFTLFTFIKLPFVHK